MWFLAAFLFSRIANYIIQNDQPNNLREFKKLAYQTVYKYLFVQKRTLFV